MFCLIKYQFKDNNCKDFLLLSECTSRAYSEIRWGRWWGEGVTFLTLVMMGGGQSAPLFLFVKTIEKVIRLCTVLKKKLFEWQF